MTVAELTACCGSSAWAKEMFARQPFADKGAMHQAADEIWWSLTPDDWLEAFSKHPKIGEQSNARWSGQEQSGMSQAADETARDVARLNADYYEKFDFIFIVCATGLTADEMLERLRARINNPSSEEIRNAATEQAKITHLRLDKL